LLEDCREDAASASARRVVIGVDPPASAEGDACGIVVCALGEDGIARVLADCSVRRPTPERWARAVAAAARGWQAYLFTGAAALEAQLVSRGLLEG
jgi:phage terminase large subunit-like protein